MKSTTFFSRGDYLATKVLLLLSAAAYVVVALVPGLVGWASGAALVVPGATSAPGPVIDEPTPGVVGRWTDQAEWTVGAPTAGQRLAALLPALVTAVLLVGALVILWRLVSTTQRGVPFDRRSVTQLRVLGVLVLAYGLLEVFGRPAVLLAVFWDGLGPSIAYSFDLTTAFPFVVGFLVLVLAESFRVGLGLRDDVEGLV